MRKNLVIALVLFAVITQSLSAKNLLKKAAKAKRLTGLCTVGQAFITYNDFYASTMATHQGWRVGVVTKDGCNGPDVKVILSDGTSIKADLSNPYYESEKSYNATAIYFNIPSIIGQGTWKVVSPGNTLGPFNFPTAPSQRAFRPSKWAFIADMDDSTYSASTFDRLQMMTKLDYQGVIHNGDFAYNVHSSKGTRGDQYFDKFSKISTRMPFIVSPGNHEVYDDFKMFNYRFMMPGGGSPASPQASNYYSFVVNGVYFVTVNWDWIFMSNDVDKRKQAVFNWLQADLLKHSLDPEVKYRVFFSHKPFYCTFTDPDCLGYYLYKPFESLFYKHKFDLLLNSHVHLYYRHKKLDSKFNLVDQSSPFPQTMISGHQGVDPSRGGNKHVVPEDRKGRVEEVALAGDPNILTVEFKSDGITLTLNDCLTNNVLDQLTLPRSKPISLME